MKICILGISLCANNYLDTNLEYILLGSGY